MIPETIPVKCAIIGAPRSGKTSIVSQLISDGNNFPKNYLLTHGADLMIKSINIPDSNSTVELHIIDCSGKDIYDDILIELWKDVVIIIAVFDVTDEHSFESLPKWIVRLTETVKGQEESKENEEDVSSLSGVIIANKADQKERRLISPKAGSDLAAKYSLLYFECSAKNNSGIEEPFFYIANEWYKRRWNNQ